MRRVNRSIYRRLIRSANLSVPALFACLLIACAGQYSESLADGDFGDTGAAAEEYRETEPSASFHLSDPEPAPSPEAVEQPADGDSEPEVTPARALGLAPHAA